MSITFSTCFYVMNSKFTPSVYVEWMNHFFSIVNQFNLVVYTDETSVFCIDTKKNPRITIVIKPIEQWYQYRYKEYWKKNHEKNDLLRERIDWKVNMLWSEKIWFVYETIEKKVYDTELYGWCDIGYFRNSPGTLHSKDLQNWANPAKIKTIDKNKIYYACVNEDEGYLSFLQSIVENKNSIGLPSTPIPPEQNSVAGGFFVLHKDIIDWWKTTYDTKLQLYFTNDYLVKDDQILILDCILSQPIFFHLIKQQDKNYNPWFVFQHFLL